MVEDKWKIKRYLPPLKTPLYTIDSEVLVEVEDVLQFFFLLQQKVPLLFGSGFKCSESSFREVHDLHDVLSFPQHNVSSGYVKYFAVWH